MTAAVVDKVKWACPSCGAKPGRHGKGECRSPGEGCGGFCCECCFDTDKQHGQSLADPCYEARCYHCGWEGHFPPLPKKLTGWHKKAWDAGWRPPKGAAL